MRLETPEGGLRNVQDVRVHAPRGTVWRQLGLTPTFFDTLPVLDVELAPDARRATYVARIGLGPIAFKRVGAIRVETEEAGERLTLCGALEDGSLELLGELVLADADADETHLCYDATLSMRYNMPRVRALLSGILDEHVGEFVREVAETAARHHAAEVAMRPDAEE